MHVLAYGRASLGVHWWEGGVGEGLDTVSNIRVQGVTLHKTDCQSVKRCKIRNVRVVYWKSLKELSGNALKGKARVGWYVGQVKGAETAG